MQASALPWRQGGHGLAQPKTNLTHRLKDPCLTQGFWLRLGQPKAAPAAGRQGWRGRGAGSGEHGRMQAGMDAGMLPAQPARSSERKTSTGHARMTELRRAENEPRRDRNMRRRQLGQPHSRFFPLACLDREKNLLLIPRGAPPTDPLILSQPSGFHGL